MKISISDFLKALDEINRVNNMALRHAAQILADFRTLTPEGRKVMADTLVELISGEGKKLTCGCLTSSKKLPFLSIHQ